MQSEAAAETEQETAAAQGLETAAAQEQQVSAGLPTGNQKVLARQQRGEPTEDQTVQAWCRRGKPTGHQEQMLAGLAPKNQGPGSAWLAMWN